MKCPHCNKSIKYPGRALRNAITYGNIVNVTTECCKKIVSLTPRYSVKIEKSEGKDYGYGPEDDWGVRADR